MPGTTMKPKITERNAAISTLDFIFKQVDAKWPGIWSNITQLLVKSGSPPLNPEYARFSFTLAVTALNLRTAFELFPREQSERIFVITMKIFEKQFQDPKHFSAISNTIRKYISAYNGGVAHISNPLIEISKLLYFNLGLKSVKLDISGKSFAGPAPEVVEYLGSAMVSFSGKWDAIDKRYEVVAH